MINILGPAILFYLTFLNRSFYDIFTPLLTGVMYIICFHHMYMTPIVHLLFL